MSKTIVIGDIHGCYDELCTLLDRVGPSDDDQIIALGDLVNRGPYSTHVLEWLRDTPNAASLMGNHDYQLLHSDAEAFARKPSLKLTRAVLDATMPRWRELLRALPSYRMLTEATLAHALFDPAMSLQEQDDATLIGLSGVEQALNARLGSSWYNHYAGPHPLIVGHHHYLGTGAPLIRDDVLFAIDTGCVYGFNLTALVLPSFEVVQVPARRDYWRNIRNRYGVLR